MIRFQKLDIRENAAKMFSFEKMSFYAEKKFQFQVLQFAHSVKFIGLDSSTRQGGSIKKTSGSTRLQTWQIIDTNDVQILAALHGKSREWGKSSSQRRQILVIRTDESTQ